MAELKYSFNASLYGSVTENDEPNMSSFLYRIRRTWHSVWTSFTYPFKSVADSFKALFFGGSSDALEGSYGDYHRKKGLLGWITKLFIFLFSILTFPFKIIYEPILSLQRSFSAYDPLDGGYSDRPGKNRGAFWYIKRSIFWVIIKIFQFPLWVISLPYVFVVRLFQMERRKLLYALPAVVVIGSMGFVFYQTYVKAGEIDRKYKIEAIKAFQNKDYELAKTYYTKLRQRRDLDDTEKYQWAVIIAEGGEKEAAQKIFAELAPDDKGGLPLAHSYRARQIAAAMGDSKDPKVLRKLRWHLQSSGDKSPAMQKIWAAYHLALGQYDQAVEALNKTVDANPEHYLVIARIYKSQNRTHESNIVLEKAEKAYKALIDKDPLENRYRIALATVYSGQEEFDKAEQSLLKGLGLQPDSLIRRTTSDFYVMRHDLANKDNDDINTQLDFLDRALKLDPNYPPVYERFIGMYVRGGDKEKQKQVKERFLKAVASDKPTPLAHFALSNIYWMEQEHSKATFHMERAFGLDKNIGVVINNLAWILAHQKEPDLQRALELAKTAVKRRPKDGRFLDTLGTVFMKLEKWNEAVQHLEDAILKGATKQPVHKKLAIVYKELGMDDLARLHGEKAGN